VSRRWLIESKTDQLNYSNWNEVSLKASSNISRKKFIGNCLTLDSLAGGDEARHNKRQIRDLFVQLLDEDDFEEGKWHLAVHDGSLYWTKLNPSI
jgi:hypothetical protein